jgi:hypothetical protein
MEEATTKQIAQNYLIDKAGGDLLSLSDFDLEDPSLSFVSADKAGTYYKFRATWIVSFYCINYTLEKWYLPHWISVNVDAETSQAWEYKPYKKPSPQEKRTARKEKRQAKKNKNLD